MLNNRLALYLAGGITHLSYGEATSWRNKVKERLGDEYLIYDPMDGFELLKDEESIQYSYDGLDGKKIFRQCLHNVKNSHVVLVNWDTVKSIGTPFEVGWAHAFYKDIFSVSSTALKEHLFVVGSSSYILPSVDEAIKKLRWYAGTGKP